MLQLRKMGHRAADCWAKGGGKEGDPKGQNGSYGKGGGILEAALGQGYEKGKGGKSRPWGTGQKGGSYGKGKGGPYCFEDDGWGHWPQLLLKIVPETDAEGFGTPKKTTGKSFTFHPQTRVETRNRFSRLLASEEEEPNEDIPLDSPLLTLQTIDGGEPHPAPNTRTQEAKATGETKTAPAAVLPSVPQAFVASACWCPHQESV